MTNVKSKFVDYILQDGLKIFDPLCKYSDSKIGEGIIVTEVTSAKTLKELREAGYMVCRENDNIKVTLFNHDRMVRELEKRKILSKILEAVEKFKDVVIHATLVKYEGDICFTYVSKDDCHYEELEKLVTDTGLPVVHGNQFIQQMLDEERIVRV